MLKGGEGGASQRRLHTYDDLVTWPCLSYQNVVPKIKRTAHYKSGEEWLYNMIMPVCSLK